MNENLEQTLDKLKKQFDVEEPTIGHFNRFEAKLKRTLIEDVEPKKKKNKWFNYKVIAVAASVVFLFGIVFSSKISSNKGVELASISPKMQETQDYFSAVIFTELEKIKKIKSEENAIIIEDAFVQLNHLEENYKKMTFDLKESNNSKQIIFAMINNYQQRITVLQNLLSNLDQIKNLKNTHNENKTI